MPIGVLKSARDRLKAEIQNADSARDILLASEEEIDPRERHAAKTAKEPALRGAIDQMCREWVNDSPRTVQPDKDAAVLFWDRFVEAEAIASYLLLYGFDSPIQQEGQMLELLLIEFWENIGVYRWKAKFDWMSK